MYFCPIFLFLPYFLAFIFHVTAFPPCFLSSCLPLSLPTNSSTGLPIITAVVYPEDFAENLHGGQTGTSNSLKRGFECNIGFVCTSCGRVAKNSTRGQRPSALF